MKKNISLLICLFGIGFLSIGQNQVDFHGEVKNIESLLNDAEYDSARNTIESLQASIEGTAIANQDTVKLYFFSKLALINYRLNDCANTIINSKLDTELRMEVYGPGDPLTLSSSRNLGVYYLNCDELDKADSTLLSTLKLHEEHIGSVDVLYVRTLDDLAFVKGKKQDINQATAYYEKILALLKDSPKNAFYFNIVENYSALLMNVEKYAEAAVFYDDLKEPMKQKPEYVSFLRDFYNVFVHQKDYVKAFETASNIVKTCPSNRQACNYYGISIEEFKLNNARLAMLLSKYKEASDLYEAAFNDYQDSIGLNIQILLEHAELLGRQNNRYSQISKHKICQDIHKEYNMTDSSTYTYSVLQLGRIYTQLGRFDVADKLFKDYTAELENNPNADPLLLAQAYQSLGNQKYLLQDFKNADLYLLLGKSLLVSKGKTKTREYASILNSLGALNEGIANYEGAEKNYRSALKLSEEVEVGKSLRISLASNLANILTTFSPDNDSIGLLYDNAIKWQVEVTGKKHPDYANLIGNRGLYFQNKKKYDEAEQDYLLSLNILEYTVGRSHPEFITNTSNLGLLYDEQENYEKALVFMRDAKQLYETYYTKNHPGYILTLNNLSNLYTKMENFGQAEELLMSLADIQVKEIRESFSYLSEGEKKSFVKEKRKFLENLKHYIITSYTKDPNSVKPEILSKWYELELNMKGILLNSTKKVRNQIFQSGDKELMQIFSEWTLARKQIADLQSLTNEENSSSQGVLDSLTNSVAQLEKDLSRKSSEFGSSFKAEELSFSTISNALLPNECSIEITRTEVNDEQIYTALLVKNGAPFPEMIYIGKGAQMDAKGFKLYKNAIAYKVDDPKSFDTYWRPVHEKIVNQGITKIYFAPDGVYHKIGLTTLLNTQSKSYMLDDFDVVQLTSTKDILDIKKRVTNSDISGHKVLLVGRPAYKMGSLPAATGASSNRAFNMSNISDLPGTEEEINEISKVLSKNNIEFTKLLGDNSSENNIKTSLNNDVIHIATHGFFIDKSHSTGDVYLDPMLYSGLLLAGVSNKDIKKTSGEDGILTAFEIMNLEFSGNDMVVLSACETGGGEVASGEGIYGLQRAFFVAGTKSLVMSLWKVDDQATKDLMVNFYKAYLKTGNKRESFTEAQKKVKKKYKNPIYWGAFVMVGG